MQKPPTLISCCCPTAITHTGDHTLPLLLQLNYTGCDKTTWECITTDGRVSGSGRGALAAGDGDGLPLVLGTLLEEERNGAHSVTTTQIGRRKPHCGGAASKPTQRFGSWVPWRADSQPEAPREAKNAASIRRTT